ncbi:MAG: putative lipid II flippase FtsW [Actinomycetota bacterium]|nr:putative lipid II flippase FtsW [Actinomycetota bacterium]
MRTAAPRRQTAPAGARRKRPPRPDSGARPPSAAVGQRSGPAAFLAGVDPGSGVRWLVVALCVAGVVMVGSASPVISSGLYGSPWYIFERELLWMVLGAVAFVVCARIDLRFWRAFRVWFLVGTTVLLVVVLMPHIGVTAGGSSRWFGFGMFRVQPSEMMKLALIFYCADLIARRADQAHEAKRVLVPVLVVVAASSFLILEQPDMGTALVVACIAFGMLFLGGVPMRLLAKTLGGFTVLALVVGMSQRYRRDRLLSFINPGAHRSGAGYQVWQSLVGLGSGHLVGLGLGGGRQKWGILPNAHTDFIFSVVGEELGLVGAVLLLGMFAALAWFGVRIAAEQKDRFAGLVAIGIVTWITAQAVINIGAVIGVLPVTGIPLPFVSFGGSSLVINLAAMGVLVNVASRRRRLRAVPGGRPRS